MPASDNHDFFEEPKKVFNQGVEEETRPKNLPATQETIVVPAIFGGKSSAIMGGLESFSAQQLKVEPPRLRIQHKKDKREDPEPGQLKLLSHVFDDLEVVFVKAHPGRGMSIGEGAQTRTVCASSNGAEPDPSIEEPRNSDCGSCDYSQWSEGEGLNDRGKQKRIPPPCAEFVAFLGVIPSMDYLPFWYVAQKTAFWPAMDFIGEANRLVMEGVAHLACFKIKMSTTPNTRKGGGMTWYTPVFTILDRYPAETFGPMYAAAKDGDLFFLPRVSAIADAAPAGAEQPRQAENDKDGGSDAGNEDIPF